MNRCAWVVVDRNNMFAVAHAGKVMRRSRNAAGNVEIRFHGLARLSHLALLRQPAKVHHHARRPERGMQRIGEFRDNLEIVKDNISLLYLDDFRATEGEKALIRKIQELVERRLVPLLRIDKSSL